MSTDVGTAKKKNHSLLKWKSPLDRDDWFAGVSWLAPFHGGVGH
jgi:hypothetical protein